MSAKFTFEKCAIIVVSGFWFSIFRKSLHNFLCISSKYFFRIGKIWSKSDKWLWRYYMTFVAMTKNTKNYAQSESNSCHTADN